MARKKVIVGISGASGAIYGIRLLEVLHLDPEIEIHLVVSGQAKKTISIETIWTPKQVEEMAAFVYDNADLGAAISSGSFKTLGMVIAPCSIKTMGSIAMSLNDNLLTRSADVSLKERRKLVMVVRETPLHLGHLRSMVSLTEMGAVILPPVPAFYHLPKTLDDVINQTIGKVLDQLDIDHELFHRWSGVETLSRKLP